MNEENKRIAKNTLILYVRMVINIAIGLFTGRVILDALGESDYGVYNVVGGFVGLFGIVSTPVTGAILRFIIYALGKGDTSEAKRVFGSSMIVMYLMGVIIIVLAEIFGVWFIDNKMVLPTDRIVSAHIVFQIAVLNFIVALTQLPYFASMTAHENFGMDAIFATFTSFAKLGVCFIIMYTSYDKLVFYAILLFTIECLQRFAYRFYCKKNFEECRYRLFWDWKIIKRIFSFAGWSSIGSFTGILKNKGGDILLNLFGGTSANAAAGVCGTVVGVLTSFSGNFMSAASPQITKSYASNNIDRISFLIYVIPRFSFYILFIFALPAIINIKYVLALWLVKVPSHTANFIILVLIEQLINVLSKPFNDINNASGNIRNYQLVIGSITILHLPLCYIMLKQNAPIEVVYIVGVFISCLSLFARMLIVRKDFKEFSLRHFLKRVLYKVVIVAVISSIIPLALSFLFYDGVLKLFTISMVALITTILSVLFVGCQKNEREYILSKIHSFKKDKV